VGSGSTSKGFPDEFQGRTARKRRWDRWEWSAWRALARDGSGIEAIREIEPGAAEIVQLPVIDVVVERSAFKAPFHRKLFRLERLIEGNGDSARL